MRVYHSNVKFRGGKLRNALPPLNSSPLPSKDDPATTTIGAKMKV